MTEANDFAKRLTAVCSPIGNGAQRRIADAVGVQSARISERRNGKAVPEKHRARLKDALDKEEERRRNDAQPTTPYVNGTHPPTNGSAATQFDTAPYLAEAKAGAAPRMRWETVDDIANAPDREYLVDRLLARGEMSLWYGPPKVGKSFLLLHIGYALAAGAPAVLGRSARPATVLYIAAEGGAGLKARILALRSRLGQTENFLVHRGTVDMRQENADVAEIIAKAKHVDDALVVIDTINRALAGGDENNSQSMGELVRNCDRIRQETGAHVAAIHHTPKGGDSARGHSSLPAACDLLMAIGVASGDIRSATVREARDIPEGAVFPYRLVAAEDVTDRHGSPIATCVVEELPEAVCEPRSDSAGKSRARVSERPTAPKARTRNATRAMDLLRKLIADRGETVPLNIEGSTACAGIREAAFKSAYDNAHPDLDDVARRQARKRAIDALVTTHEVARGDGWLWLPPSVTA